MALPSISKRNLEKEGIIDPVRKFMGGPRKNIFDKARKFIQDQDPNFAYIEGDDAGQITTLLSDPNCFKGNSMQQVKLMLEILENKVNVQIKAEIARAKTMAAALKKRIESMDEFGLLNEEQKEQISRPFDAFNAGIDRQRLIAVIRDTLRRFEENEYQRLLSKMTAWAQPAPKPDSAPVSGGAADPEPGQKPKPPEKTKPRIEYVPSRNVKVSLDKAWLADEADVGDDLKSMRRALLEEIRKGKRIQI